MGREPSALARDITSTYVKRVGAPAPLHVVPDGHVDLLWGPVGELRVAGPDTRARSVALAAGTIVAVRFRVGRSSPLLGVPASDLTDRRVPLAAVWGRPAERLAERLEAAAGAEEALGWMRAALSVRLVDAPQPDRMVAAAIEWLCRSRTARVAELSDQLGVSERHLRRRFSTAVGYGPRTFHRVARMQRFLAVARGPAGGRWAELAAALGFVDQAHLSNECVKLTGATPGTLLRPVSGSSKTPGS